MRSDTKPIVAVYIGRRITVKNKPAYFWQFDGEDKPRGYKKRIAYAVVGERWEFHADDAGAIRLAGDKAPKRLDITEDIEQIREWSATDEAHYQMELTQRSDRKLAARRTQFDAVMEPLKEMISKLRTHEERAAFIARVQSELWRR